ncbi:hypothetical protein D0869_13984 [Hortaea werneckii]|uniref:Amine oxidase domain-containing protein n=1 Tax=Hortaea werneckii TaxID=91943 RepID=A0A3M6XKR6_HORWE|nr:hypothetical protein KC324_g7818 [Hortaea werneckii]KAI7546237.1 hypothetical protein KC316_g14788 [Hortaea werneckii]RMX73064.1 hypothetical protein D0869_13984 [Hortaea werneckii]RMX91309.1 hypothetical protein D0868_14068 [Hortaea werneckii]
MMQSVLFQILSFCSLATAFSDDVLRYRKPEVIERDVCIIGGGSSGTYSAIRLQQMNKTFALIEREDRLGGHVNTYIDPVTNQTLDYGVVVWENVSIVRDYFGHLDVPLSDVTLGEAPVSLYANFANVSKIPPDALASGNLTAGFASYLAQLAKYPYLTNGFNIPDPVPEDLLLPWGDFIRKYDLGAIAFAVYSYNQGMGNVLAQPTLYVLKYFTASTAIGAFTGGFVTTARHNNQELYDRALERLGSNALVSTHVIQIKRAWKRVEVLTIGPNGPKLIRARKLLITIPPKLANLKFLDTDPVERRVFGQFNSSYYWNSIIKVSKVPDNTSITNIDVAAPHGIPAMPGPYAIGYTGVPGLHTVYYSSPYPMSDEAVKSDIIAKHSELVELFGYGPATSTPEFVGFQDHNPYELTVSADAIRSGFYGKLESLQGRRRTWWTGAAWQAQDSSAIWNFTETIVLPQLCQ